MTAILRDASGKMHHGILFNPPLRYTVATCTTLNKGSWEGKALFFPFEASRPLKCPSGQSVSTSFVPDCSVEFYFFPTIIN